MACIALFARGANKTYAVLRALLVALLVMVLVNPLLLLYDPGLQLSCIATLGLILGTPIIEPKLAWMRTAFMREIIATSIVAQVAVLPLLLYQSGNLSVVALPATVLATPVIPLAMGLSFVASIVALVVPSLAPLVGIPAYLVLSYVIGIAQVAASLPFAQIIIPAFPAGIMFLVYAALALLVARLLPRESASQ
jgi:competence protein ComEC